MARVTNAELLAAITSNNERLGNIETHLKELNGTVKANCVDIAVLKEKATQSGTNWGRLVNIALAILQGLIVAKLLV